jgi:hypothetical protein
MDEEKLASIYNAYIGGSMSGQEMDEYETDVKAGVMQLPQGKALIPQEDVIENVTIAREEVEPLEEGQIEQPIAEVDKEDIKGQDIPPRIFDAYFEGKMTDVERQDLGKDIWKGNVNLPEGMSLRTYKDIVSGENVHTIEKETGIGEGILGAIETPFALGTAATTGAVGDIIGKLKGLGASIASGKFGTKEGGKMVERAAQEMMSALTYAPRGEVGKEKVAQIGKVLQPLEALGPLGGEIGAFGRLVKPKKQPEAKVVDEVPTAKETEVVGTLVKKAAEEKIGSAKAREKLAEIARVDPEAQKAAERMGIDLPADVFSDSQLVKEAAGQTRGIAGSEASAAWKDSIINAADKADDAIRTIDASNDIASISNDVKASLNNVRDTLHTQARDIYSKVDDVVSKKEKVTMSNLNKTLNDIVDEVGTEGLSKQEAKLLNMLASEDVTYGRLLREKSLIGKALENKDSPYGNMDAGALKRLYGSIKEDQLDSVERIGGADLRGNLRLANQITAKQKALEKRIISSFGTENEGSIASLMRRSITQGAKGDITALNKLLKSVPKELQKETIATALMASTRAAGGEAIGGFGFSEFAKAYRGLRNNAPVYSKIVKVLGEGSSDLLTDLYKVSKRVTTARANVAGTGKANQPLLQAMIAEGLTSKVLNSTVGKAATVGAAATGGWLPAMMASGLMSLLTKGKKDKLAAAAKMFKSDEFNKLATEAATKKVSDKTVRDLTNSGVFKRWNKAIGNAIKEPEVWILESTIIPDQEKEE